ncbi:formyltetrahydrofolate deformylase [Propionibacteriaceae bacterium ES.041]|uniref:formyltetrahydrofolate deformylase n=1 Tax=Enemella evansiae TaxID=2016499 RepID=UPI000B977BF0|nr:formyltetrahydrofolate deformylase [Enemella evansiae]OYN94088.1 formyltetrahydrofolate deformylase [Enemella evansiae]PFG68616.1 formyltetrahydrofolate deformylase [Propionibacteriaceae bacterium ES.041]
MAEGKAPNDMADHARLVVQGDDRPGIVSAVSGLVTELGGNIVSLAQATSDPSGGRFFQRTVFYLPDLATRLAEVQAAVDERLGQGLGMDARVVEARKRKRVAIFASKADHCLLDLLWRQRRDEIEMTVPMVISNHPTLGDDVRGFGIPFFHIPMTKENKPQVEAEQLKLLAGNVDLVVLARYMQVLSGDFLEQVGVPVINIHHSFLPAFMGANPYQRAKDRGVKLVGATAHYVTEDLDEGPIIEQDVTRASHEDSVKDLQRKGASVERGVLSRAVAWHCQDRVFRDGHTTVVL